MSKVLVNAQEALAPSKHENYQAFTSVFLYSLLPVEVLVPVANSRSKHGGIYTGPSLQEPYKSHNNLCIYKTAYNNMMNHVIIFLVPYKKPKLQNLTKPLNRSRSTKGNNFNKI